MKIKGRLVWTTFILVFFFVLMMARVGYIQLVRGDYYARKALAGETEEISLEDYPRGQILDRNLRPLSGTYTSNRILVFPEILKDEDAAAIKVASVTGSDAASVRNMFSGSSPVLLPFNINGKQCEAISDAGIKGVLVVPYSHRYGDRPLAAHVLGFLGRVKDLNELQELTLLNGKKYSLNDWTGRQGIELYYEKYLKGEFSSSIAGIYTDAAGRPLAGLPVMVNTRIGDSTRSDVVTTIDSGIQDIVERVMDKYVKKGAVVVMDTKSGDILAMASRPAYSPDPEKLGLMQEKDNQIFINQAIHCFHPGSVFKIVVAAAALSEGVVNGNTLFYCSGARARPIPCWKKDGHGLITFDEGFAQSCNPVFVKVGQMLGAKKLIMYARKMGLENQSIIGFPVEPDKRQKLDLIAGKYDLANSSIGQGPVLATPLQITAMTNTVASGGFYLQPRLVKEIRPSAGPAKEIKSAVPVRVLSPEIAGKMGELMEMVTRQGVGRKAWVSPEGTAGKTGSAQEGEDNNLINAWFSGYGPLNRPRYTVTVLVRDGVSGGESAAPVFKEIMEQLLAR